MGTIFCFLNKIYYICIMETKNNDPINNVTWKGALTYLHRFVNEKIMNIIYTKNLSESDAITLLSINEDDIYLARRQWLRDNTNGIHSVKTTRFSVNEQENNYNWATIISESSLSW